MTDLAGLYAIIGLQFLGLLVTTWRCDSGAWDRATLSSTSSQAIEKIKGGAS